MALAGSAFTFLITTLGALNVFFVKKNMGESIQRIFLGFAGGVPGKMRPGNAPQGLEKIH